MLCLLIASRNCHCNEAIFSNCILQRQGTTNFRELFDRLSNQQVLEKDSRKSVICFNPFQHCHTNKLVPPLVLKLEYLYCLHSEHSRWSEDTQNIYVKFEVRMVVTTGLPDLVGYDPCSLHDLPSFYIPEDDTLCCLQNLPSSHIPEDDKLCSLQNIPSSHIPEDDKLCSLQNIPSSRILEDDTLCSLQNLPSSHIPEDDTLCSVQNLPSSRIPEDDTLCSLQNLPSSHITEDDTLCSLQNFPSSHIPEDDTLCSLHNLPSSPIPADDTLGAKKTKESYFSQCKGHLRTFFLFIICHSRPVLSIQPHPLGVKNYFILLLN